jgi:hypothetical protein
MTMSLARGLTTLNTKKRKPKKFTQKQREQNEIDRKAYNKRMRKLHLHNQQMNSEEYEQYLLGNYKGKKKEKKFEPYVPSKNPYYRETPDIPSNTNGIGNCFKKESPKYTGTLITGIATMHKSNAVPITNKKQAIDVANMRRN